MIASVFSRDESGIGQMRKKLEGLSRKEIQQLAMDANLKANQKTASLIEQLALLAERRRSGRDGFGDMFGKPLVDGKPGAHQQRPLGDLTNFNSKISAHKMSGCQTASSSCQVEGELSEKLSMCSLGGKEQQNGKPRKEDESEVAASDDGMVVVKDLQDSSSGNHGGPLESPGEEEEESEMETIRETLAQLLELGFSEEEAQWAIDEAKKKRQSNESEGSTSHQDHQHAALPEGDGELLAHQLHKLALHQDEGEEAEEEDDAFAACPTLTPPAIVCGKQDCPSSSTLTRAPALSLPPSLPPSLTRHARQGPAHDTRDSSSEPKIDAVLHAVLRYLDTWTLSFRAYRVCTYWQASVVECLLHAHAPQASTGSPDQDGGSGGGCEQALQEVSAEAFAVKFAWARFLAEGGFKKVYLVYEQAQERKEAVSVMDMRAMAKTGNDGIAVCEVRLAFLLSRLVEQQRCEHFVRVFQFFRTSTPPPLEWGNSENKAPKGSLTSFLRTLKDGGVEGGKPARARGRGGGGRGKVNKVNGDYQYIRMEFCDGGDVEEALRAHACPPARVVVWLLRQMARGLLFAEEELMMRHYDIKLLNFFLKSEARSCARAHMWQAPGVTGEEGGGGGEHATADASAFWEPEDRGWVVKLADYGTADIDRSCIGAALEDRHVTTWENVLPDLLLYGDGARQGFEADVHALGLCFLHLCAGEVPYEEVVAGLRCPGALAANLANIWRGRKVEPTNKGKKQRGKRGGGKGEGNGERYRWVAALLEAADEEDTLLQDTLYRNLVLFAPELVEGCPLQESSSAPLQESSSAPLQDCSSEREGPVLAAVRAYVLGAGAAQWQQDVGEYSLMTTSRRKCAAIARAQNVLACIPNGMQLMSGMVCMRLSVARQAEGERCEGVSGGGMSRSEETALRSRLTMSQVLQRL